MDVLRLVDGVVLATCAAAYLGTGVTLRWFLLPIAPSLTPATYKTPFVEPIARATRAFTPMSGVMLVGAAGLIALELGTARWIAPAVYLVATIAASLVTTRLIFPVNARMRAGISDPEELQQILTHWRHVNTIRFQVWIVEWVAIVGWWVARGA
jgi:hypothetical protein